MDPLTGTRPASPPPFASSHPGLRLAAATLVLLGLLTGFFGAVNAGAQTLAVIELRVHSCPDDFDGTGFFQHQTQCTSERSLYGVGIGVQAGQDEAAFQYSQPDDTGRAALMRWDVLPTSVTVTEVAPDPIKPSVAFCSLQPTSGGPLTMDGDQVPLDNGVMTISLNEGDTLMCDWYRFPGGVTAGDDQGADRDGDGLFDDDETNVYSTDPDNADTDGDGVSDGAEVYFATDPLVANEPTTRADTDEDGLYDDDEEQVYQTDPATFDTDGDGVGDGEEVFLGTDPTVADGNGGNGDLGNGGSGGVTFDPETGTADEELTGGQIFLRTWQCEGINERPEILNVDSADGLAELTDACTLAEDTFPFFLGEVEVVGDGTDVTIGEGEAGVYPPLQVGDSPQYRGWNGLAGGGYAIRETVPTGYDQPLVLCDGVFRDAEVGANIFELTAINGEVLYDLAEGELMLCDWFNRRQSEGNANVDPNDRDRDGVSDIDETELYGTEPDDDDTDDDRVVDGDEIRFGLDPLSADTDRDGYTDGEELYDTRTDPLVPDPGGDVLDPEGDEDGDSLLNGEEVAVHGTDPRNIDSDGDRLEDSLEVTVHGTNPTIADTDGDGFSDADEVDAGTDPLDQNQ